MIIILSVALVTLVLGLRTGGRNMPILWVMALAAVLFGATVKGIDPASAVFLFIFGFIIFAIDESNDLLSKVTRRPHRSFAASTAIVTLVFLGFALFSPSGLAVSSLREAPLRFLSAVLFSILDVVIIYMLFGMVLWPFLKDALGSASKIVDREAGMLAFVIGAMTTAIVLYVAALWTHESLLWDAQWPWMVWTMGNNARYATMLIIPCFWYLMRIHQINTEDGESKDCLPSSLESLGGSWKPMLIGICLILPLSMLVAVHGQTSWTSDAAIHLNDNMDDGEDFLLVSDSTLGMHWLYSFHLEVDADGSRNITGHWRASSSEWQQELDEGVSFDNRGNLSQVRWLVLAPEVSATPGAHWSLSKSDDAPWMNAGGEWTVWVHSIAGEQ